MPLCMICGTEIDETQKTKEHLIPRSVGGRRTVEDFIHRACNSIAGETWDTELADQLQPLSLMFSIARQGGGTPPIQVVSTANEHLTLGAGGSLRLTKPTIKPATRGEGRIDYQIVARDLKDARRILRGLKRKHPEIDIEATLAQAEAQEAYARGAIRHNLQIGGKLSGRSIVKSCLAMAFASGIDWSLCLDAVNYIREPKAEPCFGYHYERDLVIGRVAGMPLHCLAVHANPTSGLILAYAEYFGSFRAVACLGEKYSGPETQECYGIDPRDGQTQPISVALPFNKLDMVDIYAHRRAPTNLMQEAMGAILGPALKRQHDGEQQRVLDRELRKAFDTCGAKPGEMLTQEHINKIARTVSEGITPFLLHRLRPVTARLARQEHQEEETSKEET